VELIILGELRDLCGYSSSEQPPKKMDDSYYNHSEWECLGEKACSFTIDFILKNTRLLFYYAR
jgi:hypothetical protein